MDAAPTKKQSGGQRGTLADLLAPIYVGIDPAAGALELELPRLADYAGPEVLTADGADRVC